MDKNRFEEIISTQKIKDNWTGIEHDGLVDDRLLKTINGLHEDRERLKQIRAEQKKTIDILTNAVNGLLALYMLRQKGIYLYDEDWWD